ncbi:innexin inx2 [Hyalella azteca]|uniref:Innexin n=1 Tax=Hyalella azteca TaxID=294128 RepID=A0A8B7PJZ2_HYAAZ|nr:innexin inx2 [Hyalella azteca]
MVLKYLAVGQLLKRQKARVENVMFHLHYRYTFIVFMVSSALISAKEYFGSAMECYSPRNSIPQNVLNTYCFFTSTYSVTKHNQTGVSVVYPGVGPHDNEDEIVYNSYYQWVPIVLFLQALSFYLPRFLWKNFEGGLFTSILQGLDQKSLNDGSNTQKYQTLMKYMMNHVNMHKNWTIRFFVCELLCLVVVISNIYITDWFLGGTFIAYGSEVFSLQNTDSDLRQDAMDKIFPRVAKCTFRKFGASGNIESHDSMCVMAVNILNVKIYIFLWYWMVLLAFVTILWLLYRICIILFAPLRTYLLNFRGRLAGRRVVGIVGSNSSLGDWFLLYHLGRCMHPMEFASFLKAYAAEITAACAPPLESFSKPMKAQ